MSGQLEFGETFDREGGEGESLTGTVSRVTYRSEASGYTVARATRDGEERTFTIVGTLPPLVMGERIRVAGTWVEHPRFGRQLQVASLQRLQPRTRDAIARYLGSGLVEGIGPKLAERVVDRFGEETLDIIETRPLELARVRGITPAKARAIADAVRRNAHLRDLTLLLEETGIGARYATRIFDAYGESSLDVVRRDPYRLARDIWGIGFVRADAMAKNLGFDPEDPRRLEAGVFHVLRRASELGDAFVPEEELARHAADLLGLEPEATEPGIRGAIDSGLAVREDDRVYPRTLHRAESSAAARLRDLLDHGAGAVRLAFDHAGLESLQRAAGLRLSDDQVAALEDAHEHRILVLTGGPGTGKTTLTRFLLDLLEPHRLRIVLAAPTGRAARRLSEATGREASTIHRLLGFDPQTAAFGRDERDPIEADVLLVDEASMIDLRLFESLLRAIPAGARLLLVGDANQLPSVGPGDVLRDLQRSGFVPVAELKRVYRQGERSAIVENAHRILAGEAPLLTPGRSEFAFLECESPAQIAATVRRLVSRDLPQAEGIDPIRSVQVLVPMYKGDAGADALNLALQEDLNSGAVEVRVGVRVFRVGDRVIQLRNDYRRGIFNGEIGIVETVSAETGEMQVRFDSLVTLPSSDWDQIALAYAITIHKSQGSEYEWVVVPLTTQHAILLDRPLFYTAVTRARRGVVLVGQTRALELALRPRRARARRSTLAERIRGDLASAIGD